MTRIINELFPTREQIPEQCNIIAPIRQNYYLVNGELRNWDGAVQEIVSPVKLRTVAGLLRHVIGAAPNLTQEAALETLSAAVTGYSNGRGVWPTMSVGERIQCVQKFTELLLVKRSEIVKLLLWEIGNSISKSRVSL